MFLDFLFYYLVVAVTLYFICYVIEVVLSNCFFYHTQEINHTLL